MYFCRIDYRKYKKHGSSSVISVIEGICVVDLDCKALHKRVKFRIKYVLI